MSFTYDIQFDDQALGISFMAGDKDLGAIVDGFYQQDGKILYAEECLKIALNDRVVAVAGKSVDGLEFSNIMQIMRTKRRPIKITFESNRDSIFGEIPWGEVFSSVMESQVYFQFLKRKNLQLCQIWFSYVSQLQRISLYRTEDRLRIINTLYDDYISEEGKYHPYMFFSSPMKNVQLTKEQLVHSHKVNIRERLVNLTWMGFTSSPESVLHRVANP